MKTISLDGCLLDYRNSRYFFAVGSSPGNSQ